MNQGLATWFALWHRRYRGLMVRLLAGAMVAAVLAYTQNDVLGLLMEGLSGAGGANPAGGIIGRLADRFALPPLALLLGAFVAIRLASTGADIYRDRTGGRLQVRTTDDLETEILGHLLRKDDTFFSRHSPAETVNRLATDLTRVCGRRGNWISMWDSVLLIVGSVMYFAMQDWRLTLLALSGVGAGAWWAHRTARHVKQMDTDFMRHNDSVRSRFEDFLRAAPEVQVGGLGEKVRRMFRDIQNRRSDTYLQFVRVNSNLSASGAVAFVLTFLAMAGVIVYQQRSGQVSRAIALVPVVLYALPNLFRYASQLVMVHVRFQLAETSIKRLLEYEAEDAERGDARAPAPATAAAAQPLIARGLTYRYPAAGGSDGGPTGGATGTTWQGGVTEVDATFAPGQCTAIVGGAGSGKSTLLKLLLGRVAPQEGQVLYGQRTVAEPVRPQAGDDAPQITQNAGGLADILSVMPQSLALLNASIQANLLFGRRDESAAAAPLSPGGRQVGLSPADLEVIERTGLGAICRMKAMEMSPQADPHITQNAEESAGMARIGELRAMVRARLKEAADLDVQPYESGGVDNRHWLVENLLGGRCDRARAAAILLGKNAARELRLIEMPGQHGQHGQPSGRLADQLRAAGQAVLRSTHRLLALGDYRAYCQLAAVKIELAVWEYRVAHAHLAAPLTGDRRRQLTADEDAALGAIALTAAIAECDGNQAEPQLGLRIADCGLNSEEGIRNPKSPDPRHPTPASAGSAGSEGSLAKLLGDAWQPFDLNKVHPYLTWRENLIFGAFQVRNSHVARLVDQTMQQVVDLPGPEGSEGSRELFTRVGLSYEIGRVGANLSGGQGQLVALTRTLLRRTPVLVLDEPTSALDPASRARVVDYLREWKAGLPPRVVILVSHDVEVVRSADCVLLLEAGRVAARGPFEQLRRESESFRRTLKLE